MKLPKFVPVVFYMHTAGSTFKVLNDFERTLIVKDIGPPVRLLVKQLPKEHLPQPLRNQEMVKPARQPKIASQALECAQVTVLSW